MSVSSVNGSTLNVLYQAPEQKSGGQVVRQQQPAPAQAPEEAKETAAVQKTEGSESKSINVYA